MVGALEILRVAPLQNEITPKMFESETRIYNV